MQRYEPPDSRLSLGQTQLTGTDLVLPRIKVAQAQSQEVTSDPPRAKVGEFFNTLTGKSLGTILRFVPLLPFKQRVFLVREEKRAAIDIALKSAGLDKLGEGSGLMCRSLDMYIGIGDPGIECNDCPLSRWDGAIPPLCSETYNVAAMTEIGELIILSFVKSSAKTGKRVFSMLRMKGPSVRPWAFVYEASTRKVTLPDKGTFYVPEVIETGDNTPSEMLAQAEAWAGQLAGVQLDVTPEDDGEEADAEAPF